MVNTSWVAAPVDREKVARGRAVSPLEAARQAVARAGHAGDRAAGEGCHAARGVERVGVQLNAPDEGVSEMEALEVVTTLPPESSTLTTGWAVKATPLVELPGEVVNDQLGGRPGGQ